MKRSLLRRQMIKRGIFGSIGFSLFSSGLISCNSKAKKPVRSEVDIRPMKILILGGTSFLGPHQVAYALSRGHTVSTFTRGKTQPTVHADLFKDVEMLIGDRESNLDALANRTWDLVIDNSGHKVEWTKKTANLLKDDVGLYLYTSSTGVYYPYLGDHIDENTELLLEEPKGIVDEDLKMEYWYGVMKSNSEIAALNAFGSERSIIVRPTYMMGPGDKSDRFIHWPVRLPKGGEILVPGRRNDPVQYIDVRDVAQWMIRLAEKQHTGTFNAVGPKLSQTMHEFITKAIQVFDVESSIVNVDDYEFLKKHSIPYLVPWIPAEGNNYGSARVDNQKALAAGLTLRSLSHSIRDTHDWWYSDALTDDRRSEFEGKEDSVFRREAEIIKEWKIYKG